MLDKAAVAVAVAVVLVPVPKFGRVPVAYGLFPYRRIRAACCLFH